MSDAITQQNKWTFAKASRLLTSLFRKVSVIYITLFSVFQSTAHLCFQHYTLSLGVVGSQILHHLTVHVAIKALVPSGWILAHTCLSYAQTSSVWDLQNIPYRFGRASRPYFAHFKYCKFHLVPLRLPLHCPVACQIDSLSSEYIMMI